MSAATLTPRSRERRGHRVLSAVGGPILAAAALIAFWEVVSLVVNSSLLPTPLGVLDSLGAVATSADAYHDVGITLERVVISTVIAFVIGVAVGVAMGLSKQAELYFRPMVVVGLGIPGPVYIVITVVVLGYSQAATTLALVAAVTPFVANIVFGSVANRDYALDEMASTFQLSRAEYIRQVIVGQVRPAVFLGLRTSFALSWKLVVLMEALSTSDGIGAKMLFYFKLLDTAHVVAYLVVFMVIMSIIESQIFTRLEKHSQRWKSAAAPAH